MPVSTPDHAAFSEITRRVYEYAFGIDTRDWRLYRSIFCDQIDMDFSSYSGQEKTRMSADDWVHNVQALFTGLTATQHSMTNPMVDLDDPTHARCRMYMQAEHFLTTDQGDNSYALGGYYNNRLVKVDTGWRLSAVTLNVLWHRGNRHIMQLATELGTQQLGR